MEANHIREKPNLQTTSLIYKKKNRYHVSFLDSFEIISSWLPFLTFYFKYI